MNTRTTLLLLLGSALVTSAVAWVSLARRHAAELPVPGPFAAAAGSPAQDAPAPLRSHARVEGAATALGGEGPEELACAGRVVDLSGQPLAGLALGVREDERDLPARAESAADGRFALIVEWVPCEIEVVEAGWTTVRFGQVGFAPGVEDALVIAAPAQPLEGQVLEPDGNPLPGAALVLGGDAEWAESSARGGNDGRFCFVDAPVVPQLRLRTALEGWQTDEREITLPLAEPLRIVLRPADTLGPLLTGTVVHPDGTPAPGAQVSLGGARARADAHGRFRLHCGWCTPETPLAAFAPGFQPALVPGYGARVDPLAALLPPERLQLAGPALELAGRLVDADGMPIKGWRVRLADPTALDAGGGARTTAERESGCREELRTGRDGEFAFSGLSARPYTLLAWGRLRDSREEQIVRSAPIAAGSRGVLLRAERNAGTRTLAGRVVDENGAALVDARVGLGGVARQGGWLARSGPAGHFEISGAPPGTLYLVATHPRFLPQRIELGPDARTHALTLRLSPWRAFRFESAERAQPPDRLRAVGANGPAELWSLEGDSPSRIASALVRNGRSQLLSVGPDAREVVLYRGLVELARFPAPAQARGERGETLLRWP